jgi:rubrerythrin
MALTHRQNERLREWFNDSEIAYLIDWIMCNSYDSKLEELAELLPCYERQEVHCLKCDNTWLEGEYLTVCPHCGNTDTEQTVYLVKEQE